MRSSKVRGVLGFVCGAGALALCLVAGFRVVNAAEVTLVTREVSLGKFHPGLIAASLAVSPDSRRVAFGARRASKWLVVLEGVEGTEYDGYLKGSRLIFDSPSQFHHLAGRGGEFLRLEVTSCLRPNLPWGARPHP